LSQLASKSNTIESLELEISNLHTQLTKSAATASDHANQVTALENKLSKTEQAASSAKTELADLKKNLERTSERAIKEGSSKASAETRIAQLEAELTTAKRTADEYAKRAETLEKKVETITTLHREADGRNQAKLRESEKTEREAKELRSRVAFLSNENAKLREASQRQRKSEVEGIDDGGVEELLDDERRKLNQQIRDLEEEVYELRQGVWRDKRREMQTGMDEHDGGFDEVDLSGTHQARRSTGTGQRSSSFQDVLNSGISAFMGSDSRSGSENRHKPRKQSLGLLSEDDEFAFDEDAFRAAHEEEQRNRLERVKEIKRGLKDWEGWRVDIVDVRAGMGGVFEV
jgi:chromosome segregation ATPase